LSDLINENIINYKKKGSERMEGQGTDVGGKARYLKEGHTENDIWY
jgi:hypothetical protein